MNALQDDYTFARNPAHRPFGMWIMIFSGSENKPLSKNLCEDRRAGRVRFFLACFVCLRRHMEAQNHSAVFGDCIAKVDIPTKMPMLIHRFGVAKESCVML